MRLEIWAYFIMLIQLTCGFYIKNNSERNWNTSSRETKNITASTLSDWNIYKQKLGLTDEKVEILKHQKDQPATVELLNRFIRENHGDVSGKSENETKKHMIYQINKKLLKKHKLSKSTLKTTLNVVLDNHLKKKLRRPRRKITFNMISDMPTDKIDYLLKIFNTQHNINNSNLESEDSKDYNQEYLPLLPSIDNDYLYENLYEDEEDLGAPARTQHNSEYSSFQDLILHASRNKWQRENDETKFRPEINEDYA